MTISRFEINIETSEKLGLIGLTFFAAGANQITQALIQSKGTRMGVQISRTLFLLRGVGFEPTLLPYVSGT